MKTVTAAEMAALDRRAAEEFGIPVLQLMENAGRAAGEHAARFISEELKRPVDGAEVFVCCGRGNKAGDGLVAARHLRSVGCRARFAMIPPKAGSRYGPELSDNLRRALDAGVLGGPVGEDEIPLEKRLERADLVLDAVLGTGAWGKPRGEAERMIRAMLGCSRPVLSIDLPSGLNADTGKPADPCVRAVWTLTMALPKKGLLAEAAKPYVGELRVLDIGFPAELTA